jgi:phosphoglycerol transferase
MINSNYSQKAGRLLLGISLTVAFFLMFRSLGMYAVVMGDEYQYSRLARLLPFNESYIPGYLYFAIYRSVNACGEGFLGCVRLLNVAFFVSAAPFIYLIGRKITGEATALLIAALSILAPINSYTAYFIPESLYFFCFWGFTWFLLNVHRSHVIWSWIYLGIIFGLTSLVKPHALFLLPALAMFFVGSQLQERGRFSRKSLQVCLVFLIVAIATKLLIGFVFAGHAGVTFFGTYYKANTPAQGLDYYISLARLASGNITGHLLGLLVLFPVPIAQILSSSGLLFQRKQPRDFISQIILYTLSIFLVMLPIVALFTVHADIPTRLHMRYYSFAFPLLLLIGAAQISSKSMPISFKWRAVIALPVGIAIIYAIGSQLGPYTPNFVDSPELRGLLINPNVFYIVSAMSLVVIALWVYATKLGARFYIWILMPLVVGLSSFYIDREIAIAKMPDSFVDAAVFTRQYLSNEALAKLHIVGAGPGADTKLFKTAFYLEREVLMRNQTLIWWPSSIETMTKGGTYDVSKIPPGKEWILLIGDLVCSENNFFQIAMNGFTLVRAGIGGTVDFKKSSWPGLIVRTQGLAAPSGAGRLSLGDTVTLEFAKPLPEKFTVTLLANAWATNVGKEFVAHVGDSAVGFKLTALPEERSLKFSNPKGVNTLKIDIPPSGVTPKDIGWGDEQRPLGLYIMNLRITPL